MRESKQGDVSCLAEVLQVTRRFAGKVIGAVKAGTEKELYKRRRRKTAVGPELLSELEEFLLLPKISRCCPGEKKSIAYGVPKEKHRMKVSKEAALKEFLATSSHKISVSRLLRYWPKEFICPSSHDRQRNVCHIHDNFPRLLQSLHQAGVALDVPTSCREAASLVQCSRGQDPLDPLSWSADCALGTCADCPKLPALIGEGINPEVNFQFQEWKKAPVPRLNQKGEPREVFTLHPNITSIEKGTALLQERVLELKGHIYRAYHQWQAKKLWQENLKLGTLLFVDDYQQNLTVELGATPTSSAYGANQTNVAIFPVVAYYLKEGAESTSKASITFFSDDLAHDHQQVAVMESRAIEIVKEKTGLQFDSLVRFSDGCGAQFKSRFCVADLCVAGEKLLGMEGARVCFAYFETNEGKSESDTRGSHEKVRVERMVLRNPDLTIASAGQLVKELNNLPPENTDKYDFCLIEETKSFTRIPDKERKDVMLPGIRKLHSITFTDGGLKTSVLSCLSCARLSGECEDCANQLHDVAPAKLTRLLGRAGGAQVPSDEEANQGNVDHEGGDQQLEGSDVEVGQDDDGEEEEFEVGDVVWGLRYGKRAPAVVVRLEDIPQPRQRQIKSRKVDR